MFRNTPFSYHCNACGRCCHHKKIQLNPYEIARLARNREISSGEFIERYLAQEQPFLLFLENGACVFLGESGCEVHPDRPLVCRLYPLGRHLSGEGEESFSTIAGHPQSEGEFGTEGTVRSFIESQGAPEYMAAADRYLELFYRLFELMWEGVDASGEGDSLPAYGLAPAGKELLRQWLDMDGAVYTYCKEHSMAVPGDLESCMALHIRAIEHQLEAAEG